MFLGDGFVLVSYTKHMCQSRGHTWPRAPDWRQQDGVVDWIISFMSTRFANWQVSHAIFAVAITSKL